MKPSQNPSVNHRLIENERVPSMRQEKEVFQISTELDAIGCTVFAFEFEINLMRKFAAIS